jgi:hypothetical protein
MRRRSGWPSNVMPYMSYTSRSSQSALPESKHDGTVGSGSLIRLHPQPIPLSGLSGCR